MNFYERHTLFCDGPTIAKDKEMFERILRRLPEQVRLHRYVGDWNMGANEVRLHMTDPKDGWIDNVAVVHSFSDNNPLGGLHGTEMMLIYVDWSKGDVIRIRDEFNVIIEKFGGE